MYTKICERCGKEYSPYWDVSMFCSQRCAYDSRIKLKEKACETCWELFKPKHSSNKYCCRECAFQSRRTLKEINCYMCWKLFKQAYSWQKFCCRDCVTEYNKTEERQAKLEIKAIEREKKTWTKRPCQLPQARWSWKDISATNLLYKSILEEVWYNVELEFSLWNYSYDLKIWDILIEINPTPTHNSTWWPAFEWKPTPKPYKYHYNKVKNATDKWYKCIMVRDWTTINDMLYMIENNFVYFWAPLLHRFNIKTKEHIIDYWYNRDEMIAMWYVEVYDGWEILFL